MPDHDESPSRAASPAWMRASVAPPMADNTTNLGTDLRSSNTSATCIIADALANELPPNLMTSMTGCDGALMCIH